MSEEKNGYTAVQCLAALEKLKVKITKNVLEIKKGSIGIKQLGKVDFLVEKHGYIAKFV